MDIEEEVLEVSVDRRLAVNSGVVGGEKVVELDEPDGDGLHLLHLEQGLPEGDVLDDLGGEDQGDVAPRLSHVPPVVAVERSIQVVTETLSHTH
jgi:hypothetical protein